MTFAKIQNFIIIIVIIFLLIESRSEKPQFTSIPIINVKNIFFRIQADRLRDAGVLVDENRPVSEKEVYIQKRPFQFFQDVKIRWDSTCHILIRNILLWGNINQYFDEKLSAYLNMNEKKRSQVNYLSHFKKRD